MRHIDFTPFHRSTIGFDNLFRLLDSAASLDNDAGGYPPYDIERTGETSYRITMAVAGFSRDELDITVQENTLIVSGKAADEAQPAGRNFLHRGIAKRAFERRFQLADVIKVTGASFENGLLNIELTREVPEHKKPRKVEIGNDAALIEGEAA